MPGKPEGHIEVSDRLAKFYAEYPHGRIQSTYSIEKVGEQWFVMVESKVWRDADDPMPSTGMAWEPVPGKTNSTRDSEAMNAETSAWGRALVAGGFADAKEGIASANEVRNRIAPRTQTAAEKHFHVEVRKIAGALGRPEEDVRRVLIRNATGGAAEHFADLTPQQINDLWYEVETAKTEAGASDKERST